MDPNGEDGVDDHKEGVEDDLDGMNNDSDRDDNSDDSSASWPSHESDTAIAYALPPPPFPQFQPRNDMDADGDDGVIGHEEVVEDDLDDMNSDSDEDGDSDGASVSVSSYENFIAVTYATISLQLEKNDPELDELTIEKEGFCPKSAHECQKTGASIAQHT